MEEDISRNIGSVMTEGGSPDLTNTDNDSDSVEQTYDIGAMKIRMIDSVKVSSIPSRNVSETKAKYKMCHRPKNFSRRDVIQPFHLKN